MPLKPFLAFYVGCFIAWAAYQYWTGSSELIPITLLAVAGIYAVYAAYYVIWGRRTRENQAAIKGIAWTMAVKLATWAGIGAGILLLLLLASGEPGRR